MVIKFKSSVHDVIQRSYLSLNIMTYLLYFMLKIKTENEMKFKLNFKKFRLFLKVDKYFFKLIQNNKSLILVVSNIIHIFNILCL